MCTMPKTVVIALFFVLVATAGLGGYALLTLVGLDDACAWAGGRTAGLIFVALVGWWAGVAGLAVHLGHLAEHPERALP